MHMQGDLLFGPSSSARAWVVALHPGHTELEARVTPEHAATFEERPEGLVVHLSPSEIRTQVWLSWIEPDAPTFGHVDPGGNTSIRAESGVIQWEVDTNKW